MRPIKTPADLPAEPLLPRWLMPVSVGGLLLYLAVLFWGDRHSLAGPDLGVEWLAMAAVLSLSLLNYLLRYWRWHRYLGRLGHRLQAGRHLAIYLAGFALTVSPGKAGESVRSIYLRREGVPVSVSLATLFVERLLDMLAVALLALLLVLATNAPAHRWLVGGGFLATFAVIALLAHPRLPPWLRARRMAAGSGRAGAVVRGLADLLSGARALLRLGWMMEGLLIGLVAWAAEGYGLYLILQMFDLPLGALFAVGAYSLSLIAGALSFLPGGVGGADAALAALLAAAGAPLPAAIAATALCRLATLWFAVLIGLAAMLWLRLSRQPSAA